MEHQEVGCACLAHVEAYGRGLGEPSTGAGAAGKVGVVVVSVVVGGPRLLQACSFSVAVHWWWAASGPTEHCYLIYLFN
jgi:hypothetical protein